MASTFGASPDGKTIYNTTHFVEVNDETYTDPAPGTLGPRLRTVRPPSGTQLLVRDAATGLDLTPTVSIAFGYFSYVLPDDNRSIRVSGDGGTTWVGPFFSIESDTALHNGTLAGGGGGGTGGGGTIKSVNALLPDAAGDVELLPGDVGARPAGTPVPATEVSGLADVAKSGSYGDLQNTPPRKDLQELSPGVWENRPATTDQCRWWTLPGSTSLPATSGSTSGGVGMVANYDVYIQRPA